MSSTDPSLPINEHVQRLITKGFHPGASGGEKRCNMIAAALLDHCVGIDNEALEGILQLAAWRCNQPMECQDWWDSIKPPF